MAVQPTEGCPSRLDLATKLGRNIPDGWWLVVYPDAAEAVASWKRGEQGDRESSGSREADESRVAVEAVRRARGRVRRYCAANRLNRLATLTFRGEGCHDPRRLRTEVGAFFKRLRRALEVERFPYVWVPELHAGGHGLHAHFAVAQYVEKGLIERAWGHGFVDIRRLDARFGFASELARARIAAAYLGKYVAKSFTQSGGLHRYEVSQGFQPRRWTFFADDRESAIEFCVELRKGVLPKISTSDEWDGWQGPPTVWMQWTE